MRRLGRMVMKEAAHRVTQRCDRSRPAMTAGAATWA